MTAAPPEHSPKPRWRARLRALLAEGLSPERLAWGLAAGLVIGCLPVLGASTPLCAVVAWAARLNQPLVQAVNYAVYPLQLLLLLPFWRLGEGLYGLTPVPLLDVDALIARIDADPWQAVLDYGVVALAGLSVWALLALPLAWLLARLALPLLRRQAAARDAA